MRVNCELRSKNAVSKKCYFSLDVKCLCYCANHRENESCSCEAVVDGRSNKFESLLIEFECVPALSSLLLVEINN